MLNKVIPECSENTPVSRLNMLSDDSSPSRVELIVYFVTFLDIPAEILDYDLRELYDQPEREDRMTDDGSDSAAEVSSNDFAESFLETNDASLCCRLKLPCCQGRK